MQLFNRCTCKFQGCEKCMPFGGKGFIPNKNPLNNLLFLMEKLYGITPDRMESLFQFAGLMKEAAALKTPNKELNEKVNNKMSEKEKEEYVSVFPGIPWGQLRGAAKHLEMLNFHHSNRIQVEAFLVNKIRQGMDIYERIGEIYGADIAHKFEAACTLKFDGTGELPEIKEQPEGTKEPEKVGDVPGVVEDFSFDEESGEKEDVQADG